MADSNNIFDLVVLGGGSGGYAASLRAAQLGLKVALIEKDKLGGTCLHRGCIPTKALLHSGEIADHTRHADEFGVKATFQSMDMNGVNTYKDGVVSKLYKGLQGLVKSRGITYVEGSGKLISANTVEVSGTKYQGKNVILATGSYPKTLPGLEIDGKQIVTSEEAMRFDYVPKSVIVLGGGVIGCEFASVWRSFGAEVTIIEGLPHLVALEDESSSKQLERAFRKRGINFELGNKITGAGFPVYVNKGAKLQRALIAYFLDFNTKAGYTEYQPPYVVNADSGYGTGQLPDKDAQMYHVQLDEFYLIPTAEVPVTNIFRDVILKTEELPVKLCAYTPCFRREAGSYGKDVRGLNRLHQFDKVELLKWVHPSRSYEELDNLRGDASG